jgi:enoyl-CoA hydratase
VLGVDGDGIATLRFDGVGAGNRITPQLAQAICDAVEEIELASEVRVVLLSAAGADFCLGVQDPGEWQRCADWVNAVGRLTAPVIAVIQGRAVAEGLELALACDLRVCAGDARLCLPQLREGRLPQHGATQRLPRLIGRQRALDLLLTGRALSAREALRCGLVTRVAPRHRLAAAGRRLAGELACKAPLALQYAKEAVVKGIDMTLDQGIRLEEDLYALLQATRDRKEGIQAFLEHRVPHFQGS